MDIDLFVNSFYGNVKWANSDTSSNKVKSKKTYSISQCASEFDFITVL